MQRFTERGGETMQQNLLIGHSAAMDQVRDQLREVAGTEATVLLLGETGTGKGVAARQLHAWSDRKDGPFVHVNCGGIQESLIDSELFGHEKGAFTGAIADKQGKFEQAADGTLFLDEIGDLPATAQAHLLRVLQEKCFERVGGTQTRTTNVRLVAATHQDLDQAVQEGRFRADLFYRLHVYPILLPPLRVRTEDIPLLVRHWMRDSTPASGRSPSQISPAAMDGLQAYDWPGNVRQLEHVLLRAMIRAGTGALQPEHIELGQGPVGTRSLQARPVEAPGILSLAEYERRYVVRVLAYTQGIIHGREGAARLLGIKPTTLRSRMERLGIPVKGAQARFRAQTSIEKERTHEYV